MSINCNEISQTASELLISFQNCKKIKNSDLRKLVDLITAINNCASFGGGGNLNHNSTFNIQGGTENERYHITSDELASIQSISEIIQILSTKVDKIEGKGLSDENFTEDEKNKLLNLPEYIQTSGRFLVSRGGVMMFDNSLVIGDKVIGMVEGKFMNAATYYGGDPGLESSYEEVVFHVRYAPEYNTQFEWNMCVCNKTTRIRYYNNTITPEYANSYIEHDVVAGVPFNIFPAGYVIPENKVVDLNTGEEHVIIFTS